VTEKVLEWMATMIRMAEEDLNALRAAVATLEHPALAARLGNIAGKPIALQLNT
jgi:hypothetical protein